VGGSLFLPTTAVEAKADAHGRLHIGEDVYHQPRIRVVRVVHVQTGSVPAVHGVGLEFLHLSRGESSAIESLLAGR